MTFLSCLRIAGLSGDASPKKFSVIFKNAFMDLSQSKIRFIL